jgi:hypothetical protein
MKTLKTEVKVKFNKDGNIKELSSPYDNDAIINNPINHSILSELFRSFNPYPNTFKN